MGEPARRRVAVPAARHALSQRPCAARDGAAHLKAAPSSWWDQVVPGDQPGQNQLGPQIFSHRRLRIS